MLRLNHTIGIIFFILVMVGCDEPADLRSSDIESLPPNEITPENVWNPDSEIKLKGKVILSEVYNLSFPISGQIEKLMVDEGDFVHAGDTLAQLDTTALLVAIAESEGKLAVSQAELDQVMVGPHEYVIAEAQFQATAIASQSTGTISETIVLEAEKAATQARLDYLLAQPLPEDVAIARAEVTQAQLNSNAKKAQLELATLITPVDGFVVDIFLNSHEYARVGETVIRISDLNKLSVQTEMYDFEIVRINVGDSAWITFDALEDIEIKGFVSSIEPDESNPQVGMYIVTIQLYDIPKGLRWGMSAEVSIPSK